MSYARGYDGSSQIVSRYPAISVIIPAWSTPLYSLSSWPPLHVGSHVHSIGYEANHVVIHQIFAQQTPFPTCIFSV
jgi:hypothetical protein